MAKIYQDMGMNREAIGWYQKAVQIKPDYAEAQFNLATVYLLTGNFQEGWKAYEWRFKRRAWKQTYPYQYDKPRWSGEAFAGRRLYVHSEQGFGDTFQFVRYLPRVKARGGTVIFETRKALIGLFKNRPEIDELIVFSTDRQPAAEFDLYVPLASLPGIFSTTLEHLPATVPYIFADRGKSARWKERLNTGGIKVGLVWAGTNTDPRRACALKWLKSLSDMAGVHLYGLQKGIAAEQIEAEGLPQGMQMINLGQEFEDFTDTAAVIENLDLVISIDTSVAHLAGAMGKPVWVMLPYVADWRWFLNRDDSPWYPTMRLFRQSEPGNWQSVGQRIAAELKKYISKHGIKNNPTD
jgi:tetratricopeptide (TPR) repeat protein